MKTSVSVPVSVSVSVSVLFSVLFSVPTSRIVARKLNTLLSNFMNLYERSFEIILENQTPNGAFLAAPDFAPYQYCWFREGALTSLALDHSLKESGFQASQKFHQWVIQILGLYSLNTQRGIEKIQKNLPLNLAHDVIHCRYTASGERSTEDWSFFQMDGLGTWLFSFLKHLERNATHAFPHDWSYAMPTVRLVVQYLNAFWRLPNADCWEEHADKIATSTLAAIYAGLVAVPDILSQIAGRREVEQLNQLAIQTAEMIKSFVLKNGVSTDSSTGARYFTRFCGGQKAGPFQNRIDGSLLWLARPYDLLPLHHPIMMETIERIQNTLIHPMDPGGVHRNELDEYYGGGEWISLTAWLAVVYASMGEIAQARILQKWIESHASKNGTLPEQVPKHLNHPEKLGDWVEKWGPSADPLILSHSSYIYLVDYLRLKAA